MNIPTRKTLGIIGGMGALAGAKFFQTIVEHTDAKKDSDHIDVILTSFSQIPDRTSYILGNSKENPIRYIKKALDYLLYCGAKIIAIPCNTAAFFKKEIDDYSVAHVLDIIKCTVSVAKSNGIKKAGIIATSGTIKSEIYQNALELAGIVPYTPNDFSQEKIMLGIYEILKAGKTNNSFFYDIVNKMSKECDSIIMGCTELSLIDFSDSPNRKYIIDSSIALAKNAIEACGGKPKGFDEIYL